MEKLSTLFVPSYLCRRGLPLRTCHTSRHVHPLPICYAQNIHSRGHHSCRTGWCRDWTPHHCLYRLIFLAIFPALARVDCVLLQHYSGTFYGLGCLAMALLLHQRTPTSDDESSYIPTMHRCRPLTRRNPFTKSGPPDTPSVIRRLVQLLAAQRMALHHLRYAWSDRRRCHRGIVDLDPAKQIN